MLGIPGLVHAQEDTRVDNLLKELNKSRINGARMTFSGIEYNEANIRCNFNLNQYINDISQAVDSASKENSSIGIITSSIGAGIFSYFISQNPIKISGLVSISPAVGWPYYGNQTIRNSLENNPRDFEITSLYDKEKNRKRTITREGLLEMMKANGLEVLRTSYKPDSMKVLTIIGKNDRISDYASMLEYHQLLGGKTEELLEYDCGHDINMDFCQDEIVRFLKEVLCKKDRTTSQLNYGQLAKVSLW